MELAQSALGGLIVLFSLLSAPLSPGTLRGVCPCVRSRGCGPAAAEARRRPRSRESHMIWRTGWRRLVLSPPVFTRSRARSRGLEARAAVSSPSDAELAAAFIFLWEIDVVCVTECQKKTKKTRGARCRGNVYISWFRLMCIFPDRVYSSGY